MTTQLLETEFPADRLPLLRWLIFTGVSLFGVALAWHFGLIRLMLPNALLLPTRMASRVGLMKRRCRS